MDANWIISEATLWQDFDSVMLWNGRSQNFGQKFDMTSDLALTESHVRMSSNMIHNILPVTTGSSATHFIKGGKDGVPESLEKEGKKQIFLNTCIISI